MTGNVLITSFSVKRSRKLCTITLVHKYQLHSVALRVMRRLLLY
jgi:hypothetical protein